MLGGFALAVAAILCNNPTLRSWQYRIICLRAGLMTAREMWFAAWRHAEAVYPEMLHKAKRDV
jgi:hypothetical protein